MAIELVDLNKVTLGVTELVQIAKFEARFAARQGTKNLQNRTQVAVLDAITRMHNSGTEIPSIPGAEGAR
jgi:hypothetical protein